MRRIIALRKMMNWFARLVILHQSSFHVEVTNGCFEHVCPYNAMFACVVHMCLFRSKSTCMLVKILNRPSFQHGASQYVCMRSACLSYTEEDCVRTEFVLSDCLSPLCFSEGFRQ